MRVGCDSIVLLMGTYNPEDAHLIEVRVGKRKGATKTYNGITRGQKIPCMYVAWRPLVRNCRDGSCSVYYDTHGTSKSSVFSEIGPWFQGIATTNNNTAKI